MFQYINAIVQANSKSIAVHDVGDFELLLAFYHNTSILCRFCMVERNTWNVYRIL